MSFRKFCFEPIKWAGLASDTKKCRLYKRFYSVVRF